jgi:hypothetical protein
LIVGSAPDVWIGTVEVIKLTIQDFKTLIDSVSLACSKNADFCGSKELILTDPNNA